MADVVAVGAEVAVPVLLQQETEETEQVLVVLAEAVVLLRQGQMVPQVLVAAMAGQDKRQQLQVRL